MLNLLTILIRDQDSSLAKCVQIPTLTPIFAKNVRFTEVWQPFDYRGTRKRMYWKNTAKVHLGRTKLEPHASQADFDWKKPHDYCSWGVSGARCAQDGATNFQDGSTFPQAYIRTPFWDQFDVIEAILGAVLAPICWRYASPSATFIK